MVDTHCHVYKEEISNYDEILKECSDNNIKLIINGVDNSSNKEIIKLSKEYSNVYAAIGLNYDTIDRVTQNDLIELENMIKNEKITAIGEIGLDYYWTKENKDKQIEYFKLELELAKKYDLPVIVHARDSIQDVYDILKESGVRKGSMHCYSGSLEMAKEFIKLGFKISVDGPITFKNNRKQKEIIENIDIKDILIETDSPYLSPEPNRGKINTPLNLIYIAQEIANIKKMDVNKVIEITTDNAKELFNL